MSDDPKNQKEPPPRGVPDDLNESDRAMLTATSHRQRDNTPLSLDQERLLDGWIAGALSSKDADRAVELTKHNKMAAERILERRLIAAANEGPDVPAALSARILRTSRIANDADRVAAYSDVRAAAYAYSPEAPTVSPDRNLRVSRPPKSGRGGLFDLRWPTFSAWQWSGLGAAAAAIAVIAIFGFQVWQVQLRSNQSFQIAMVTIEDRSVLLEGSGYRTRGRKQQPITPYASSGQQPTESYFRDMEVPTALLRRVISGASTNKGVLEYSELMSYLRAQDDSFGRDARIVIDSALADIVSENLPERTSTQIRAYDLNDQRAVAIRGKISTLPANAQAILLTLRR
jgi:hypothetical protein